MQSSASGLNAGSAPLTDEEAAYVPAAQIADAPFLALAHTFFQPSWIVRAESPEGLTGRMQRALAATDPNLLFSGFYSMNDLRASTLTTQRIEVALGNPNFMMKRGLPFADLAIGKTVTVDAYDSASDSSDRLYAQRIVVDGRIINLKT